MFVHPWKEIGKRLEELGMTQKAFSLCIGKKVSEINELIKGKRNITLAWDYLLCQFFWTEEKYWMLQQLDYDYEKMKIALVDEDLKILLNKKQCVYGWIGARGSREGEVLWLKSVESLLKGNSREGDISSSDENVKIQGVVMNWKQDQDGSGKKVDMIQENQDIIQKEFRDRSDQLLVFLDF